MTVAPPWPLSMVEKLEVYPSTLTVRLAVVCKIMLILMIIRLKDKLHSSNTKWSRFASVATPSTFDYVD